MDDKITVQQHDRKKPKKRKPEKEDGTGLEVRVVAPQEGTKIIIAPTGGDKRAHLNPRSSGVQVLGGGGATKNGIRQGVKRVGGG